jgi:hypothetical protein
MSPFTVKDWFGNTHHPASQFDRVLLLIVQSDSQRYFIGIQGRGSTYFSPSRSIGLKGLKPRMG